MARKRRHASRWRRAMYWSMLRDSRNRRPSRRRHRTRRRRHGPALPRAGRRCRRRLRPPVGDVGERKLRPRRDDRADAGARAAGFEIFFNDPILCSLGIARDTPMRCRRRSFLGPNKPAGASKTRRGLHHPRLNPSAVRRGEKRGKLWGGCGWLNAGQRFTRMAERTMRIVAK